LLAGIAAGQWTPVKVPLAAFGEGQPGFKADRWTLGSCLQRLEGCSSAAPAIDVCLDQVRGGGREGGRMEGRREKGREGGRKEGKGGGPGKDWRNPFAALALRCC